MDRRTERRCSGCMACKNICPRNCIRIRVDGVGNFIRVIDTDKCINCGHCEKICPSKMPHDMAKPQKAYIAWSKKLERRSASGGVAASIYRYCLAHHVKCVGVRYDKKCTARYRFLDKLEDIEAFASSKYVHSDMEGIYQKIRIQLKDGKRVVFIGLPCHVAALRNIVGWKESNLICIDLVCHGVPNERFLSEHMASIRRKIKQAEVQSIDFREKENPYGITVKGTHRQILWQNSQYIDEYMLGYCEGFVYCEQCYRCSYAQGKRCSDLTIKDFCGKPPKEAQGRKLSSILVNTKKGDLFMSELKTYLYLLDDAVEQVIAGDAMLRRPTPRGKREKFVRLYPMFGFDNSIRILCFATIFKNKIRSMLRIS